MSGGLHINVSDDEDSEEGKECSVPTLSSTMPKTSDTLGPYVEQAPVYVAYPRPVLNINGVNTTPLLPSTVGRHNGFLRTYKVLVVGEAGVGKSNLLHRYCYNQYNPALPSTIGAEFCSREVDIPSGPVGQTESVVLQLWDTAGQERNAGVISSAFYRNAVGAIVVYDVTRRETLLNVPQWVARVMELAREECVCVVVGAKFDLLKTSQGTPIAAAEVEALQQEADRISHALGMRNFFTSALSGEGVLEAVTHLVLAVDAVQSAPPEVRTEAAALHQHHNPRQSSHSGGCLTSGDDRGRGMGTSRGFEMWTAASTVPASPVALFGHSSSRRWSGEPCPDSSRGVQGGQGGLNASTPTPVSPSPPGMTPSASGYMSHSTFAGASPPKQKRPLDLRGFGPGESGGSIAGVGESSWGC